jgi:hypothetical protein
MIFQAIDDKSECVGVYTDGKLYFEDFPSDLTRTWKHGASIIDPSVEYGWIWSEGKTLAAAASDELKGDLQAALKKMQAYRRSFEIAKINLNDHCIFDLVPHGFLMEFCEIKNKITEGVFDNMIKPSNYDHLASVHQLLHKISYQKLNLNFENCKHLLYSSLGRQKVKELINNYRYIRYNLFGTVTGRLTTQSNSFPILTIRKDFRQLLKPCNDLFVSLDYNGAEIRTFLDLCGSEQPLVDIHTWNIENVFKKEEMSRDEAKTLFFAWLYNPDSDQVEEEIYNREKLLDNCYKEGYINTRYKRKIKVEQRKALNYLIQSTTADRVLAKAVIIDRMLEGKRSFISHIVHDEIVIDYCDDEREMIASIKNTFEDGYLSNVNAGKDYYNLSKLEI